MERAEAQHVRRTEALGAPAGAGEQGVQLGPVSQSAKNVYPHRVDCEPRITLLTPEGVARGRRIASGGTLLDLLVCVALATPGVVVVLVTGLDTTATTIGAVLGAFGLLFLYDVLFETYRGGRTPGRRRSGCG